MRALIPTLAALLAAPVAAHEFWIEPEAYQIEEGVPLGVRLRNGEDFVGVELSFFSRRQVRYDRAFEGEVTVIDGRDGDRPSATLSALPEGLNVLIHETTVQRVSYDTLTDFMRFVTHKDLGPVEEMHRSRGLPDTDFTEAYTRFAKALVAVGDGAGQDQAYGLAHEFIALENPYTGDMSDGITLALERGGVRRGDAQVELFEMTPDGEVSITFHRTDANGEVTIPVKPGHRYLADAVILFEPSPDVVAETGAVWETDWAALTFAIPAE